MESIGLNMARARENAGYTQRQAASLLNISQGYLGGLEVGVNDPKLFGLLTKMAEVYSVSIDQLILGTPSGDNVRETNEKGSRLSPSRYKEVLEIAKLFLLLDSQEYRNEVIESLISGSEMFGGNRVLDFLIAVKESSNISNSTVADALNPAD